MASYTHSHHHAGLEEQIKSLCYKLNLHMDAQKEALKLAREDMDRRLKDTYATIERVGSELKSLEDKLVASRGPLSQRLSTVEILEAREQGASVWKNYIVAAIISAVVVTLAHYLFKL